ncbi:MAG TPA: GNAT family N-acetyltransferase [Candidatus Deferrimicrobium sp.]|nr:GNAT family N-acetyltransferase [Candidatus Deferrimicrobium sp.]
MKIATEDGFDGYKEKKRVNFVFRTFREGDQSGIIKTYIAAFCKSRFCEPMTPEFWAWKYGATRPNYAPEGYQICEYKGKIIGSIMTTLRTMQFNGEKFLAAGIDDVSTCPVLEKKGIARRLMDNAIKFMEENNVDLSILTAEPGGHAKKLYQRLGYTYMTYISAGIKLISFQNTIKNFKPIVPIALPFRLFGKLKSQRSRGIYKGNNTFEILIKNQDEFRQNINSAYRSFYSFDEYDEKYWNWYYIERPKSHASVVIAVKENNEIIAGGTIIRSYLMIINPKEYTPVYILTDLFVDKKYQRKRIGSYLLNQLERAAKQRGVSLILAFFHGRNIAYNKFLKNMGYLTFRGFVQQMIKPISERAKEFFRSTEGKKFVWKVPFEQMGF